MVTGVAKTALILFLLEKITDHRTATTVLFFILSQYLPSHDAGQVLEIC